MPQAVALAYAAPFRGAYWVDLLTRSEACPQLSNQVLLHAGPPFCGPPPAPVMHAAMQAVLFEGLAATLGDARDLIEHGAIELRPAQDFRVATPLAQVVSASMPLFVVQQQHAIGYAPIIEGAAPALRFGSLLPACVQRLRELSGYLAGSVAPRVRSAPVAIDALIQAAVAGGDECHARTAVANEALMRALGGLETAALERLRVLPAFVLPLLMAAACAAMQSGRCDIEALGGNGQDFGVRWRGERTWRHLPAQAPEGIRFAGAERVAPLGAIGDSAVIDFCGLGGQALAAAPLLVAEWHAVLPTDALTRRQAVIDPRNGMVDAARVRVGAHAPIINLAILDRDAAIGLIGRGFYCPPLELFAAARRVTPEA